MWADEHPFVFVYLLGCAISVVVQLLASALLHVLAWITKDNVLAANLRKVITPPDKRSAWQKVGAYLGVLLLEATLSWISVLLTLGALLWRMLKILRDAFTTTPQAIQELRFPLRNNPTMTPEGVWAYLRALRVKAGEKPPEANGLLYELDNVIQHYPNFNRQAALEQLRSLNVISAEVTASAIDLQMAHDLETASYREEIA